MNWRIIGVISLIGTAMGVFNLYVDVGKAGAWIMSIVAAVLFAISIARFQRERYFLHAFLAGFIYATISSLLTGILWETFLERHPAILEQIETAAERAGDWIFSFSRYASMLGSPLNGAVNGLLLAVFTWLATLVIPPLHPVSPGAEEPTPDEVGAGEPPAPPP
ncbi:MAG: hypothetical protein V2G42_05585 [bacterium JZ-2024 1]